MATVRVTSAARIAAPPQCGLGREVSYTTSRTADFPAGPYLTEAAHYLLQTRKPARAINHATTVILGCPDFATGAHHPRGPTLIASSNCALITLRPSNCRRFELFAKHHLNRSAIGHPTHLAAHNTQSTSGLIPAGRMPRSTGTPCESIRLLVEKVEATYVHPTDLSPMK